MDPYRVRRMVRCWPFRGRYRLARLLGLHVATLPEGDVVRVEDGRRFRIHRDGMYFRLFMEGSYHTEETEMFRLVVRPGDVVADIGANFGWYTTLFARIVGPTGRVHAFEPSPRIVDEFAEQVALNCLPHVVVLNQLALGDEPGKKTLHTFSGLPHGCSSLSTLGRDDATDFEVEVVTLDDYMENAHIDGLDLAKCDVEGAEMSVLAGAQKLLVSERAPIWLIEMNENTSCAFGYVPGDALQYLANVAGYDTFLAYRRRRFVALADAEAYEHGEVILCARAELHEHRLPALHGR